MARLIVELTNRCNLRCQHCFEERHAAVAELPMAIVDRVIAEGQHCGIDEICFTGGEPTVHRQFELIVRRVCAAGYSFGMVSNGWNFQKHYPLLKESRERLSGLTFSLDGAKESTHDRIRGSGSYRRVIQAASLCLFNGIPFTFNMVLTNCNSAETAELVDLAERLGCRGVRFGHLMFTPETAARGLDLSPAERRRVETDIWRLRDRARIPVTMAPGYFAASPNFRCAPLQEDEYNLDYRGNLTLCCQLSGYAGPNTQRDSFGNLHEVSLAEALAGFHQGVVSYLDDKAQRIADRAFSEWDHFPCLYCVKYLGKLQWLKDSPGHPWADLDHAGSREAIDVDA